MIRVAVFIGYILVISLLPDLRRVFQYHGAEHKTIHALEKGEELTVENVQRHSLVHPRCGTAFLLYVMVIAIFVFAFVGQPVWYWLILSRIAFLPLIAGLAYEVIRYAGKHSDNRVPDGDARAGDVAPAADDPAAGRRPGRGLDPCAPARARARAGGDAGRAQGRHARRSDGVVPRIVREAVVAWEGTVSRGSGVVRAASSGAFELPVTIASRVGDPEGKSSPEELIAAAHATCFVTSLGGELARAETPPERLEVRCTITMDQIESGDHRIVSSHLAATAVAPGADAESLARAAEAAEAGCPISALVRASATVTVEAKLEGGE